MLSPALRSLLIPKRGNRRFKAYWRGPKPSISMSLVGPNSDLPQCRHFGRYHVQSRRGMTTSAMRARQHMSAPTQRRLIGFQQQQLVIGFERHRIDERSRGRPSHRGELPGATKHATKRRLCVQNASMISMPYGGIGGFLSTAPKPETPKSSLRRPYGFQCPLSRCCTSRRDKTLTSVWLPHPVFPEITH